MSTIAILPDHVVRRIQAGEVVERPASAAKELLENAIDAGAGSVRVSIERGGRDLIMVEDDGCGMDVNDIVLCTMPHATSKLDGEGGLDRVSTYGFRGEALSALATVGELTVSSRARNGDTGWRVKALRGDVPQAMPCSRPAGSTSVEVSGLFASHPARLAFLRPVRTEVAAIRAVVENAALAQPEIAFSLESDGRRLLSLHRTTQQERIAAIAGARMVQNSVCLASSQDGMSISGLVGVPGWRGHTAAGQRFIVNGRPVSDRVLANALKSAFTDLSALNAPAAIVLLTVPSKDVDINCHPAKTEIRFREPGHVHTFVRAAVRQSLAGQSAPAAAALAQNAVMAAAPVMVGEEHGDRSILPLGRAVGIVMEGYGLSEGPSGLIVCDLHALAERAAYERLVAQTMQEGVQSRILALPMMVESGHAACAAVEEAAVALSRMGFAVHAMDDTALSVSEVPAFLPDHLVQSTVRRLADELAADMHSDGAEDALRRMCASLACHAAFRFGDDVSLEELDGMLRDFERTPNVATCMHGRPTFMALDRRSLDRMFSRR
jgi:DNA mismatch repair protein MutL